MGWEKYKLTELTNAVYWKYIRPAKDWWGPENVDKNRTVSEVWDRIMDWNIYLVDCKLLIKGDDKMVPWNGLICVQLNNFFAYYRVHKWKKKKKSNRFVIDCKTYSANK